MIRRNAGLTLLEVMIASIILVSVVLMAMSSLSVSTSLASKSGASSEVEQRGVRFLAWCRDNLSSAQFTKTITSAGSTRALGIPSTSYNTAVGFRVPGNRDASGAATAGGAVVFGYDSLLPAPKSGFYQDLACFLRFEADTVYKESSSSPNAAQAAAWGAPFPAYPALVNPDSSSLQSQILGIDVNGDGDQSDTYVRGKIVKYVIAPTGSAAATGHAGFPVNGVVQSSLLLSREVLSDGVLLRVNSTLAGDFLCDLDGHATSPKSAVEALFRFVDSSGSPDGVAVDNSNVAVSGQGLLVTVAHGNPDSTGKGFIVRKNSVLLRFRSTQQ